MKTQSCHTNLKVFSNFVAPNTPYLSKLSETTCPSVLCFLAIYVHINPWPRALCMPFLPSDSFPVVTLHSSDSRTHGPPHPSFPDCKMSNFQHNRSKLSSFVCLTPLRGCVPFAHSIYLSLQWHILNVTIWLMSLFHSTLCPWEAWLVTFFFPPAHRKYTQ